MMLTTVYITGISAFNTVYMKLFIQSALVKTQRLNITIYYDRKNNYFVNYTHTHTHIYIYINKTKSITFEELCYLKQCTWAVHKEGELFFLICCFTYNLIKLVSFKVLPSTLIHRSQRFSQFWNASWNLFCWMAQSSRVQFSSISSII